MIQDALRKWKFVVEFEDEETKQISGTVGEAETREECEGLLEFEMEYHASRDRIVVNAEASEVCAACGGGGCDACGECLGAISNLTTFGRTGTEFLLIRRGDFSGPLSPRRAA